MTTARTSSAAAARAAAASSSVTWSFSALTLGRLSLMVPMPSVVSSVTNSAINGTLLPRGADPPGTPALTQVAVRHPGRGLRVRDQAELGAAVEQRVVRQHADRVAERPGLIKRHLPGVAHDRASGGTAGRLAGFGGQRGVGRRDDLVGVVGPPVDHL